MTLDADTLLWPWTVLDDAGVSPDQSRQTLPVVVLASRALTSQPVQANVNPNGEIIPSNNGHVIIEIVNTTGTSQTARFYQPNPIDGVLTGGRVVTIAANTTVLIGPFPPDVYNWIDGSIVLTGTGTLKYRVLETQ